MEARSRAGGDWTSMTPSDWMNVSPADWMNMTPADLMSRTLPPWWDTSYGDLIRTTPTEWWNMMVRPGATPGASPRTSTRGSYHHGERCCCRECQEFRREGHHHDRRCRRCGSDPCQCFCCIGDVDFAVYSRLGEQRVIPIVVENDRRREKQITLELSGWTTRSGKAAPVETVILEPKTFSLASCGEQKVTLVVKVQGADDAKPKKAADSEKPPPDVDDCLVATADLRLVGCDHRPIRVAVAILPRDCDPYTVTCGCTCC